MPYFSLAQQPCSCSQTSNFQILPWLDCGGPLQSDPICNKPASFWTTRNFPISNFHVGVTFPFCSREPSKDWLMAFSILSCDHRDEITRLDLFFFVYRFVGKTLQNDSRSLIACRVVRSTTKLDRISKNAFRSLVHKCFRHSHPDVVRSIYKELDHAWTHGTRKWRPIWLRPWAQCSRLFACQDRHSSRAKIEGGRKSLTWEVIEPAGLGICWIMGSFPFIVVAVCPKQSFLFMHRTVLKPHSKLQLRTISSSKRLRSYLRVARTSLIGQKRSTRYVHVDMSQKQLDNDTLCS